MGKIMQSRPVDMGEVVEYHANPRRGDVEAIKASLEAHGQYRPIVVNVGTKAEHQMEILAGNHTFRAAKELGWKKIDAVLVDVDDEEAARIILVDNRTADLAENDDTLLVEMLSGLPSLEGTGYDADDLTSLLHGPEAPEVQQQYKDGDEKKPPVRKTRLDAIFSSSAATSPLALFAYSLGWKPGIITTSVKTADRFVEGGWAKKYPIAFMDNEWHDYDHAAHLAALAAHRPKYATVRDLVTKKDAADQGVDFYTLDQTIRMAEEVAEFADNVILIPKYDCIADLPREVNGKRVVLGYSVHSSYGGTPLPISAFAGWPIHLLGGSWKKQRALLNLAGEDVVSIDNNNILAVSQFGQVCLPDGNSDSLTAILDEVPQRNFQPLSCVISLVYIMDELISQYGVEDESDEMDMEGAEEDAEPDEPKQG